MNCMYHDFCDGDHGNDAPLGAAADREREVMEALAAGREPPPREGHEERYKRLIEESLGR